MERILFYVRKTEALEAVSGWTWRHVTTLLKTLEKDAAAGRGLWKFIRITFCKKVLGPEFKDAGSPHGV